MTIRLLDFGEASNLRTQSLYHGIGSAMTENSPDSIIIVYPREPYVCIGFHQDLEKEIDLDLCDEFGLRIVRRNVGGGAVYLDSNQLFFQCVFHRRKLPLKIEEVYRLFLEAPARTYRKFGVDA